MNTKLRIVRQLYITIVAIVALAMVLVSGGYLVHSLLYGYVFTGDNTMILKGYPPSPVYTKEPITDGTFETCTNTCIYSDAEKEQISEWLVSYEAWKQTSTSRFDTQGMVTSLSFFIVGIPLFIIHIRMLWKEWDKSKQEGQESTIIHSYFYVVALGTLIASVVYAALLVNTTLRTWVFKDSTSESSRIGTPVEMYNPTKSIESCGEVCEFTADEQRAISQYNEDYDAINKGYQENQSWQKRFSSSIAGLLVSFPVFLYHLSTIRKNRKTETS